MLDHFHSTAIKIPTSYHRIAELTRRFSVDLSQSECEICTKEAPSPGIVRKHSPWAVQNKKAINMCRSAEQGSHSHFLCFSVFPFSFYCTPFPPPLLPPTLSRCAYFLIFPFYLGIRCALSCRVWRNVKWVIFAGPNKARCPPDKEKTCLHKCAFIIFVLVIYPPPPTPPAS